MDYRKIADGIQRYIENKPNDHTAYLDLLSLCRQWEEEDFQSAHDLNGELRRLCADSYILFPRKKRTNFMRHGGRVFSLTLPINLTLS